MKAFSQVLLQITLLVLPVLLIKDFGNSFTEPKQVLFFFTSALLGLAIISSLHRPSLSSAVNTTNSLPMKIQFQFSLFHLLLLLLTLFQLVSLIHITNPGLHQVAIATILSSFLIGVYCLNFEISLSIFYRWLWLPLSIVLGGALAMILFRVVIFSDYAPFGSSVGLKNSLSVYLAQTIPFLLILLVEKRQTTNKFWKAIHFLLLVGVIWVLASSRTRSAWWMAFFIFFGLSLFYFKMKKLSHSSTAEAKATMLSFFFAAALGILCLNFIPNSLNWRSDSPYLTSISNMVSLENSSGRDKLWTVGLHLLKENFLVGVGTGNYSPLWRNSIAGTQVDPKIFAFLRPDLPAFNDYLQFAIENGVPAGALFILTFFLFPAWILLKTWKTIESVKLSTILMALGTFATSVDAFFDYPFLRSETMLLFILSISLCLKSLRLSVFLVDLSSVTKILKPTLWISTIFSLVVSFQLFFGLGCKWAWLKSPTRPLMNAALMLWPWDSQWDHRYVMFLLSQDNFEAAEDLVQKRVRAWPQDPESYLMRAKLEESKANHSAALAAYKNAIHKVQNGQCHLEGFQNYQNFLKFLQENPERAQGLTPLAKEELASCE